MAKPDRETLILFFTIVGLVICALVMGVYAEVTK
jgi:hypothetical protein